jgi:hypothetical protein
MTNQEREQILKWAGYKQISNDWFNPKCEYVCSCSLPNLDSIDTLMEIVERQYKGTETRIETTTDYGNYTHNTYYVAVKAGCHIIRATGESNISLVEALQQALIKLSSN